MTAIAHPDDNTPRRPNIASADIQLPAVKDYEQVDRELLSILRPTTAWFASLGLAILCLLIGVSALIYQIHQGLGVAGYNPPVMWGVYIITFVFWVGIGHAGTLISAILYLFRAGFRTTIYRAAEAMTVFAVMTAGLFPIIHIGRPWKFFWLIPYPNWRLIWPNFKSPLVWDVFAITTYLTISTTFLFVGLIPDIAVLRDRETNPVRKRILAVLSFGWRNTEREWRHFARAYLFLAAFSTPLVLSVHSIVSFDFAMGIVPGWHTTIFPPYFVAGAIFSGFAMVWTIVIPMRRWFNLRHYVTLNHLDASAKMVLFTSMVVGLAYIIEFFIAWYGGVAYEQDYFWNRVFGQWWWAAWIMLTCNMILPLSLFSQKLRRNPTWLFILSIFINIGMWFERFVIVVPSLSHDVNPWQWTTYSPTWVDYSILLGSFGWFFMWFLLFVKQLPVMALAEIKEIVPPKMKKAASHHGHGGTEMMRGMLGVFAELDSTVEAIEELKKKKLGDLTVYTPTPRHELEHAVQPPPSPLRKITLITALSGMVFGYWVAIWASEYWPLVVGGKAISTWLPYTVFGFELFVMVGGLGTVFGMFYLAGIPRLTLTVGYDERFSAANYGVWCECAPEKLAEAEAILRRHGAVEVRGDR